MKYFVQCLCMFFQILLNNIKNQRGDTSLLTPDGTKNVPPSTKTGPKEITMKDLQELISVAVKGATEGEIAQLRKDIAAVDRKQIFPNQGDANSGEVGSQNGSIIDMSFMSRAIKMFGPKPDDIHKATKSLCGPFKKLSPTMEMFAKHLVAISKNQMAFIQTSVKEANDTIMMEHKQAGMNEGVLADGGALVPTEFMATVVEFAIQASPILSQVWRVPMSSNLMRIPRLAQAAGSYFGGIQLYSPDEGKLKTESKPTLERFSLTAKKRIGLIYLTDELIADSLINVVNYVTMLYTRAFQYDMENLIISSALGGVTPCLGIINAPGINIVPRQTAGQISVDDILNLDAIIDENFRDLTFLTRKRTQIELMKLRDMNNRPIFISDYSVFQGQPMSPNTMITYPVYKTRNVPVLGTQGDVILGDLGWYILGMRQDLTVDVSAAPRFVYDEQTIRFVMRYDGCPAIPEAFAILGDVQS